MVVFDAVGTLIVPHPPVAEAYAEHARQLAVDITPQELLPRFKSAMARQAALDDQTDGRTSPRREHERWRQIVADVFHELPDTNELFARLWQHFGLPAHWRVTAQAAAATTCLDAAGIPWAIGSNFDDRLFELHAGLSDLAACPRERVFVSARVGHLKPFAGFFRHIEAAVRLTLSELLLVGDDPRNDYEGARAAGWQAILLERDANLVELVADILHLA